MTRELPMTVLAWEGPQARAYLVAMQRAGLRPRRIVQLVRDKYGARGTGDVPALLGIAARFQERAHDHHPRLIRKRSPELVRDITDALDPVVPGAAATVDAMFDGFRYDAMADTVELVGMSGYGDPRVRRALDASAGEAVLFTGGGILPRSVFEVPDMALVHVHTGLLPYVRGADVLLWSLLTRGRAGVSAFLLAPGLDEGDVLATREHEPFTVPVRGARPDDDTLYRALFSFVDPLLRAQLLVDGVLRDWDGARPPAGEPQDLTTGVTYHFMDPVVRSRALGELFVSPRASAPPPPGKVVSAAAYQGYYEKQSVLAPLRFTVDAMRAPTPLRRVGLRNRQQDYGRLAERPELRPVHAEINRVLVRQEREWPSYDYGEGYHYQSSAELGITGLRDTEARVDAFDLRSLVDGQDVLEIGCNAGFLSLAIEPAARRVVAFELNPFLIDIARIGAEYLGRTGAEFSVSSFEEFPMDDTYDVVLSFANHHTYDGNTSQSLAEYFDRCHALLRPGGRFVFESHPPALEGAGFAGTRALIDERFDIDVSEIHEYGTVLDRDRRLLVGTRR